MKKKGKMNNQIKIALKNIHKTTLLRIVNKYSSKFNGSQSFKHIYHHVTRNKIFIDITLEDINEAVVECKKEYDDMLQYRLTAVLDWLSKSNKNKEITVWDDTHSGHRWSSHVCIHYDKEKHKIIKFHDNANLKTFCNEIIFEFYINIKNEIWECGNRHIDFPKNVENDLIWSVNNHKYYPVEVRKQIFTFLLVYNRLKLKNLINKNIKYHIIHYIAK